MAGLADRAASTRAITGDADPLPLFLEDPLHGLDWAEKAPVLEFLGRLAARQQIILVTADQEVLAWARLEAMTGGVAVAGIASGEPGVATGAPGEVHEDKRTDGS
jgi:ABC-type molybdate transport system ATPase subunit